MLINFRKIFNSQKVAKNSLYFDWKQIDKKNALQ